MMIDVWVVDPRVLHPEKFHVATFDFPYRMNAPYCQLVR